MGMVPSLVGGPGVPVQLPMLPARAASGIGISRAQPDPKQLPHPPVSLSPLRRLPQLRPRPSLDLRHVAQQNLDRLAELRVLPPGRLVGRRPEDDVGYGPVQL